MRISVAHLFPDDVEYQAEQQPQRRRWIPLAVAAALALSGVASAFAWRAYGGVPWTLPSFAFRTAQPAAPAVAAAEEKPIGLKDLQALQQQIAGPLQSNAQLLAAQQAEIKRLSDQVAGLAAKVDALEHPPAIAQAAVPASAAPSPAPGPAAPRKKSAAPKRPAAISVGGAPLPPAQPAR
jgi:cell division protein FtsB